MVHRRCSISIIYIIIIITDFFHPVASLCLASNFLIFIQHCSLQCPFTYIMTFKPHNNPVRTATVIWFSVEETKVSNQTVSHKWEATEQELKSGFLPPLQLPNFVFLLYQTSIPVEKNKDDCGWEEAGILQARKRTL